MNIYVGNLAYTTTEEDLRTSFSAFGAVDSVNVITDRDTGRSKGFAFIEMSDDSAGNAAIKGLDGQELGDRALKVSEARPREERR
ncbi:RNA recognition motif domain-containing protein [Candidatus Neomarinimicrobiota bacterium]